MKTLKQLRSEEELLSIKLRRADWTYRFVADVIMMQTLSNADNDSNIQFSGG